MTDVALDSGPGGAVQPIAVTCELAWKPTEILLALYLRDAYAIRGRGIELPHLRPKVEAAITIPGTSASLTRLEEQWYLWWREALDAADINDQGRRDWSVLYGDGGHSELSQAFDLIYPSAVRWLQEWSNEWEALRESGFVGRRLPFAISERWGRDTGRIVTRFAVVPTAEALPRQLRDSLFMVPWDLAASAERFDQWVVPILESKLNAAIEARGGAEPLA